MITEGQQIVSERAFLRQRLAMVDHWLSSPDHESTTADTNQIPRLARPVSGQVLNYNREARLLRKLLAQTREGQALKTLRAWRRHLGRSLLEHRLRYAGTQDACDAW